MAFLLPDGLGTGKCCDRQPDSSDGEHDFCVPPLLAGRGKRPLPHLRGLSAA